MASFHLSSNEVKPGDLIARAETPALGVASRRGEAVSAPPGAREPQREAGPLFDGGDCAGKSDASSLAALAIHRAPACRRPGGVEGRVEASCQDPGRSQADAKLAPKRADSRQSTTESSIKIYSVLRYVEISLPTVICLDRCADFVGPQASTTIPSLALTSREPDQRIDLHAQFEPVSHRGETLFRLRRPRRRSRRHLCEPNRHDRGHQPAVTCQADRAAAWLAAPPTTN